MVKHDKSFKHYIPYVQHYISPKIKRNVFLSGSKCTTKRITYMCAPPYSIPSDKAKRLLCFTSFIRFSIDVPDDPPVGNPLLHFNRNNCLCCICSDSAVICIYISIFRIIYLYYLCYHIMLCLYSVSFIYIQIAR